MGRVPVAVEQADREGLGPLRAEPSNRQPRGRLVEGRDDLAVGADPLGDLQPPRPRHQQPGLVDREVVDVRPDLASQLQDVAKAPRGEETDWGPVPLEQGIRRDGGAVGEECDRVRGHPLPSKQGRQAGGDALGRVVGRRGALEHAEGAPRLVEQAEIGERAAYVHADAHAHRRCAPDAFTPHPVSSVGRPRGHRARVPASRIRDGRCPGAERRRAARRRDTSSVGTRTPRPACR